MDFDTKILQTINALQKPKIIAISGFGGSGKSSCANNLAAIVKAPVIGVDSFFMSNSDENYSNWDTVDFPRLEKEVLKPFHGGKDIKYGHFDWNKNTIEDKTIDIKNEGILIVEGVGLFRPELMKYFSYKIWIDCPIEVAVSRGKKRDREYFGNQQDKLWDGIWKNNDVEFYENYKPKENADLVIDNSK